MDARPAGADRRVHEGGGQDGDGDRDVAEVGEELPDACRVDEPVAEAFVRAGEGAVGRDLPGDQREEEGRKAEKEGRPPRNRGGSGAAVRTGLSRAPGVWGGRLSDR